ncbi:MAG TPA: ABC transporter substrate-binding protein [Stellaceae bacterium]|nr:ABC transporter substrate-binding protein [Stellaceae bacterium]
MRQITLTRRSVVGASAAAIALSAFGPTAWAARDNATAAITGFNVINTLDPGKASLIQEYFVLWAVFNGLLKFDDKMEIVPDLAESYAVADPTTYTFKLRPNVRFHDGSMLSADDVKFTFDRLLDEKFASPYRSKLAVLDSVEVVDPLTIRIKTKEAYAPLLTLLCNFRNGTQIVPRHAVETMGAEAFARRPIGTGAFKIVDWQPGQSVKLEAFGDYFLKGQPVLRAIEVLLIAEESSGETAVLAGQVDLTSSVPPADAEGLRKRPEVRVLSQPGLNNRYIALNNRRAPFDDVHFRRALSMAFDRGALIKAAQFNEAVASQGLIPPTLTFAYDPAPRPLTQYNAEQAKKELAQSKHPATTPAAVLTWGPGFWKQAVEIIVAQANDTLGTSLRVEVTEANTVFARLKSGEFDAAIWGWLGVVDPDDLYDILHSNGWRNFQGYANTAMDQILERGRSELDRGKRGEIYKKAEAMMVEDMPLVPCFCSNTGNLLRADVIGFTQKPFTNFGDQFATLAFR